MQEDTPHFTIEGLAEQVAIPVRTIRYYISEGLLPGPEGRGKAASYGEEHLQRLRLIRLLSHQHRPLAEIQQLLCRLSLEEIRLVLADEESRTQELTAAGQQLPQQYVATLLKKTPLNGQTVSSSSVVSQVSSSAVKRVQERSPLYQVASTSAGEDWKRWELAPGIELHVKEEVREHYRELIERIWKAADQL